MKPLTIDPQARLEALEASAYLAEDNPEAARKFVSLLQTMQEEIRAAPQRFPFESGRTIQRRHMLRFPFTIYFREDLHEVRILAIAHTSRRPDYGRRRIGG